MHDCVFCQVITGSIPGTFLYKDDEIVVFKDINPQASVHWLVVSRKHVSEYIDADDDLLLKMLHVVKKIIIEQNIQNYRIVNNGKGVAVVDHVHIHVLGQIDKLRKL